MKARAWALVGTGMSFLLVGTSLAAAPVPREGPISGRIVAKKQGETAVLVPTRQQRPAEVRQDLKAGDVLRTNAAGTLAIVFADRTQIRLGRNSTLVVKQVRQGSPSSVTLQRGSLWSRSPRGASNLSVETPSATAAIRGTEYSIVADEEQTTLSVIDGVVDFFNPQGSLEVREGQSASARLGQAPTRIFTVNPATREQMLYYMALEEGLAYLRPSPVSQIASRSIVERVKAIAPDNRTPEDWILLAEAGAEIEAKASIVSALARARSAGLTPGQEARAKLVEAGYAAKARDFRRALRLYEEALPSLSGRQREVARYGRFIARTLVDPAIADEELPPLNEGEAVSYVGQAYIAAYLGEFDKARAIVDVGLRRFPNESALYAIKGGIGILTGDEKAMDEASQRALAIDPADPFAISIRAVLDLHYRGNPEAAVRSAEVVVRSAPGKDEFWSLLGEALHTREETRKAESAFLAGLAEEPHSFIMRGNYSLFLLQLDRTEESREQLRIARGLDPDNALVHLIEGFLDLKEGRRDLALEHALDASAANPSYSEALLLLAEIHYANGDYELARQQLDAADKADPKNPFVALYRAAFAIDHYEADAAILAAREAVRRYRARGGVYASLSESKGTGSYIAGAFRFLNLGEWARYHGDRNHDPFVPVALFDRALSQVPDPFLVKQEFFPFDAQAGGDSSAVSDVFQGLRLDPLSISAPEKDLHITRQKFFELSLTPSLLVADERVTSSQSATINGLLLRPTPLAFSVVATHDRVELPVGRNNDREGNSVLGFFGLEPSPHDHLIIFTGYSDQRKELTGTLDAPRDNGEVNDRSALLFALYAHQFGREHIVSLGGGLSEARRDLKRRDDVLVGDLPFLFDLQYRDQQKAETKFAFLDHAIGLGAVDLQAGAEYMTTDMKQSVSRTVAPSNSLTIQGQVALTGTGIDGADDQNFDFSFGVAVEPIEGHWLRAAYVRNTSTDLPFTLAPTAVVGLRQNDAPVLDGSQSESVIGRWDAEWDEHLFTSVEVQHQDFDGLSFDRPNIVTPIINFLFDPLPGARPVAVGPSELTRVSVSANLWLTGNIGVRAVYSFSSTDVMSGPGAGGPIPFISRHFARGQVTWTHPSRIRVSGGLSWTPRKTLAFDGVV